MLRRMDWQETIALLIVAATLAAFAWAKLRPRKLGFRRSVHCGCATTSGMQRQPSVVFQARKGEKPRVVVKMK